MDWTQPEHTPGKLCLKTDRDFAEVRYQEHIPYCRRHVTHQMKVIVAKLYNVPEKDWHKYEFDHLLPLSIGGANDEKNLWCQPIKEAKEKDKVEEQAYLCMKNATCKQKDAIKMIWDWFKGKREKAL